MSRDDATLLDIVIMSEQIIEFTAGIDGSALLEDRKTQLAVLHLFTVLGEAVKRLSPQFRAQHPDIPWRKIAGMRDVIIHEYDDVNIARVWLASRDDIPRLLAYVKPLVSRGDH